MSIYVPLVVGIILTGYIIAICFALNLTWLATARMRVKAMLLPEQGWKAYISLRVKKSMIFKNRYKIICDCLKNHWEYSTPYNRICLVDKEIKIALMKKGYNCNIITNNVHETRLLINR